MMGLVTVVTLVGVIQTTPTVASAALSRMDTSTAVTSSVVPARRYTVTLLTGDRVSVDAADATSGAVTPAKGREHLTFETFHTAGHLYVVPQDAQRLIRDGKVDRRLFDVSELVTLGYDDTRRTALPVIVQYATRNLRPQVATLGAGTRMTRELPAINGAALEVDKAGGASSWSRFTVQTAGVREAPVSGIGRIWLDGKRKLALDQSVPQIGAPVAWQAGLTGNGVSVAVLDTGIDATHPDFAGRVVDAQNFTDAPNAQDEDGHGTHVASIIAGAGTASGGRYKGVAPEANLLVGKVCGPEGCPESAILAGMHWAATVKHAKVVNMSLGGVDALGLDPVEEAVNTLTAQTGTLFVIASGNDPAMVSSPGSADAALTVGAVGKSDELTSFSGRGPRLGDDAIKPDITAPGLDIVAARAAGTEPYDPVDDSYARMSGTSMAAPHATGSVALLAQQHPEWSATGYKAALTASAKPSPAITGFQQGAGRLDVARAITQSITSDPISVSFGRQLWPHADDKPITRTVTYHNGGAADVALDLSIQAHGPDPASLSPSGLFTLSTGHLAVPAGGAASVDVATDTRVGGADGQYSGQLLATGGTVQVSTALGVIKEVESYNLTLVHIDRNGAPARGYWTHLTELDTLSVAEPPDSETGTVVVRLPRGRYDLFTFLDTPTGADTRNTTLLTQPVVDLTADRTVTLDARTAGAISATVPEPTAIPILVNAGYDHNVPDGISIGATLLRYDRFSGDAFEGLYVGHVGEKLPGSEYVVQVGSQWTKRTADGGYDASAYWYALSALQYGQLPAGFSRHYRKSDLAVVLSEHAAVTPGSVGQKTTLARYPGNVMGWGEVVDIELPFTRPEYVNTDSGLRWKQWLDVAATGNLAQTSHLASAVRTYRAGGRYLERWNSGPFGPALLAPQFDSDFVTRRHDRRLRSPLLRPIGARWGRCHR